jgi:HD domain protein
MQQPNLELIQFIETNILPRYNSFGKSHGLQHVSRVIKASITLANQIGANVDMAYVIAAYHDLGMSGPRAVHHLTGGRILNADSRLKKWFSTEQIKIMKEAVEDHRASASRAPRSIYGKIVAEADKDLDPDVVFTRAIQYGIENYPLLDEEQQWKRFVQHMNEKYSARGYIHSWIPGSSNAENLKKIQNIIEQREKLHQIFKNLYVKEKRQ